MDLLILGVGGHGRIVSEIAKAFGIYDRIVFLDDDYCENDKCCKDNQMPEIIGRLSDYEKYKEKFLQVFVAIGNSDIRKQWQDILFQC